MLTYLQSIILGAVQGLTELFPISSLGHSVILPSLLGWQIQQGDNLFLVFLVATHLATALVLVAFFWRDWLNIALGFFRSVRKQKIPAGDTYARLSWLLIIATVPAGLLGILFESRLKELFASPHVVALFLMGNGVLLFGAELLKKRKGFSALLAANPDAAIARLSVPQALGVGMMQSFALLPGFSRTGAALGGGLLAGLDHQSAARFSFLLATPIILAAAVLKLPGLVHEHGVLVAPILLGALVSAVAAYLSITFLTRYFKQNTLLPFAWYCLLVGAGASIFFLFH